MTIWLHTTILATSVAATIAVGIASAAKYDATRAVAPKADLLPVSAGTGVVTQDFVTVANVAPCVHRQAQRARRHFV